MERNNFTPMVPFMPENPQPANAYVPYQMDIEEFPLSEAHMKGSLFVWLYSPFKGDVKGDEKLC